ncbi:MAG: insulinase family protein [Gammaproteobacteria bacterium]|nr:insulinase family protein [Gammaproteobacteria bacterium]
MSRLSWPAALSLLLLAGCAAGPAVESDPEATEDLAPVSGFSIPIDYHELDNGLKVVLSPDPSVPVVTVGVYYNIGFRIEPRERTGFAHLFEHLMFQGSDNLGKMEFISLVESNGGVVNGSTRFDYTNYFEVVPAHKLETMLWAEADRMRSLAITEVNLVNQKDVVKNEVKVNVLNQPYGGFPWLDMPQHANENWYNAHNFYGELEDLDAATLDEARSFFETYYGPNNAVLVVVGDFEPASALAMVEEHFGDIEPSDVPPLPDISEPRQAEEKHATETDPLAPRPALAFAYHVPERGTPEHYAMGIIDQILVQGEDSRLHRKLVQELGVTDGVFGGINMLGSMFDYNGPMLWTAGLLHDERHDTPTIMAAVDEVIQDLRANGVTEAEFERALVKMRSGLYSIVGSSTRFGLLDLLASFALFDDDPARINRLEEEFREVTPELIRATAEEYLRPGNRTVLTLLPQPPQAADSRSKK